MTKELAWVIAGTIAWFGIRIVSPKVAGVILIAIVVGALVKLGPQIATIGK